MNFLSKLLQGIAFVPAVVNGIEGLFGGRSGADKKDAALSSRFFYRLLNHPLPFRISPATTLLLATDDSLYN